MAESRDTGTELGGGLIVFEGSFNPAIFHPQWLVRTGVIPEELGDSAVVRRAEPDLSAFEVDWFTLEARRARVTIASTVGLPQYRRLGEIAAEIFKRLPHSPVTAIGLTRAIHSAATHRTWVEISRRLVSWEPWAALGPSPALQTITMAAPHPEEDTHTGAVEVTVEASHEIDGGVYIAATDRIAFAQEVQEVDATPAIDVLESGRWGTWLDDAEDLIVSLLG